MRPVTSVESETRKDGEVVLTEKTVDDLRGDGNS